MNSCTLRVVFSRDPFTGPLCFIDHSQILVAYLAQWANLDHCTKPSSLPKSNGTSSTLLIFSKAKKQRVKKSNQRLICK